MNRLMYGLCGLPLLMLPLVAQAYVGPGAGLSAIGSLLALVVAVVVAIIGFLWFPVKRLLKRGQKPTLDESEDETQNLDATQNVESTMKRETESSTKPPVNK